MKPGDLVRFVWGIVQDDELLVDAVGVLIEYTRSYGSNVYYSVLVNGKIEFAHENELEVIDETR